MTHLLPPSGTPRPKRAAWRESPTGEALAFDRWRFSGALGGIPGETRIVRPGAFVLLCDCPAPIQFIDPETGQPREGAIEEGGIATLSIVGPLEHQDSWWWASYHAIRREVEAALAWPTVRAVVLKLDTPGGVCAGMLACHRALRSLRAKHGKPLVAFVDEMAASAGYGLASACDEIWGPPEMVVGSIGVILCTIDESKRLEKEGIAVRYVVTGARKADLQPGAAITDEVLRVAQGKVDELGTKFFAAVASSRGMSPADVEALEAAVFMGSAAVDAGLADGIADWPNFLGTLRRTLGASLGTSGTLAQPKGEEMRTKMQAQKAKDEAEAAVKVAQAAVAVAKGSQLTAASKALADAVARHEKAEAELAEVIGAKVVHREKYEKVTTETPDKDEAPPASEEDEPAASGPPASGDPATVDSAEDARHGGKMKRAEDEGDEEKALVAAFASADRQYKAKATGVDAYGVRGPVALLAAVQKALGTKGIGETFGALSALPARMAAFAGVEKDVAKLKTESRATRVDALLASAARAGKIGGKAHRDHLRGEAMKHGSTWLKGHLAIAPVVVRTLEEGGYEAREGDNGRGQFTHAEDKEREKILAQLSADLSPEEAAKLRADINARLAASAPKIPAV